MPLRGRNKWQGLETTLELVHQSEVRGQDQWSPIVNFIIERGVLQGSVLSPVLFLLVMDPLLQGLEANHLGHVGPSLRNTYLGALLHA